MVLCWCSLTCTWSVFRPLLEGKQSKGPGIQPDTEKKSEEMEVNYRTRELTKSNMFDC